MYRALELQFARRLAGAAALAGVLTLSMPTAMLQSPPADAQLFDDRVLQRIDLQVSDRDWDTLRDRFQANTYYPASFSWRGQSVGSVGIRSRGSGTRSGVKPGLLVDFDRYVSGQTFLGLKALVLDNHLQDPSSMREAVTMAILGRMGLPVPREAHAELFINGEFFGVYGVVENLDSVAMRRMFAPIPASATDPSVQRRARIRSLPRPPSVPAAPGDFVTGYLFEYEWLDYYYETYLGLDLDPYAERFDAETRDDEPLETLYRPIEQMFREINQAPDDRFVERVSAHLDLVGYVRLVAVETFMADWDGVAGDFGANNFYLYRPANGGPHRFIPWDTDHAFYDVNWRIDASRAQHVLVRRALQVADLERLFLGTLEQVARLAESREGGQAAGWLEREIARRHALMSAGHARDRVRPHPAVEVEGAVAYNTDFARRRPAIVRQQIQAWQ